MAIITNFHGKNYVEPGAYAVSVYNPTSVVNVSQYGNVMIIDTGISKNGDYEFAGGSGIQGELANGSAAIYQFDNYEDFLSFIGGGLVGSIAEKIFTPREGVQGAPKIYYARAAKTTAAKITLTIGTNTLTLACKNEGIAGNGVKVDGTLKVGYSAKIVAGIYDTSKFKLQIYKGSYAGVDEAGEPYGAKNLADAPAYLLAESGELSTFNELYEWASSNKYVLANFKVSKTGDDNSDLVIVNDTLASGGTTDYNVNGAYDDVLEAITELDISFFLCTNTTVAGGTDAATNGKLFTFLKQDAKFNEFMFVPAGGDDTELFGDIDSAEAIAKHFNSENVVAVFGSPEVTRKDGNGTKYLNPIYLTATIIGLVAGGQPQTPLTFKRTGYQNYKYNLKKRERERALQAGILHVRNISGYYCINQGITTLLDNKKTIANDGQSLELSIAIIKAQLNKELVLEAEVRFCGSNAATASPQTVKNFVETKLASLTATSDQDNLIVDWKNVKTVAKNSEYFTTYDFVPNVPVNKLFFTGNIMDFSVTV
jgi:hypothetical protein